MQKIVTPILIALVFLGCASAPVSQEQSNVSKTVDVKGFDKADIYKLSKMWIAQNFRSAKKVIEFDDAEAGTIIGNGITTLKCSGMQCLAGSNTLNFTMQLDAKKDKFRLTFSNLSITTAQGNERAIWKGDLPQAKAKLLEFADDISAFITKSSAQDDW